VVNRKTSMMTKCAGWLHTVSRKIGDSMRWSDEYVDAINDRWRDAYIEMMEKMHKAHDDLAQTHINMLQAKTAVERQHDRLLAHVQQLFGTHPNFPELVAAGYYDPEPHDLDQ
jgi:hypothetical protein